MDQVKVLASGRLYKWLFLCLFPAGLLAVYHLQLAETNGYLGYRTFAIDVRYLSAAAVSILVAGMIMPSRWRRPSDSLASLYALFVVIPYATLFPMRGPVEFEYFIVNFFLLTLPLLVIRFAAATAPPVRIPALVRQQAVVWLIAFLCVAGLLLAFSRPPASAGFDLASATARRLEGRSSFPAGSFLAYLNTAVVNGFAPFLAFIAGWRKKLHLLLLSVAVGVGFFYLLGLKAPVFLVALGWMVGYAVRMRKIDAIMVVIYGLIIASFILFLVEYVLFGFSFIGEVFIRRIFSVPPFFVSAYFEFISSAVATGWSPLYGVGASEPITFLVGETFLGIPDLNANTNAFLYQLASGGIPMYAATIVLVTIVFAALDAAYRCRRNAALIYLGFVYAMLLNEQAATTALVSSGVGLLILLSIVTLEHKGRLSIFRLAVKRTGQPQRGKLQHPG